MSLPALDVGLSGAYLDSFGRQQYQLDAVYYIEHQLIPPIERVLNLVGANVASWYAEMPKVARPTADLVPTAKGGDEVAAAGNKRKFTIDEHFKMQSCIVCGRNASQGEFLRSGNSSAFLTWCATCSGVSRVSNKERRDDVWPANDASSG